MSRVFVVVVVVGLFAGTKAEAQTHVVRGEDTVRYKKRTVIDGGGVTLTGEPVKPDEGAFFVPPRPRFASMIRVRRTFSPELEVSAGAP